MSSPSSFRAPWWLPGGNVQTLYGYFLPRTPVPYRRQRVETPDGDFIDFDWLDAPDDHAPVFVLFHGLEGSSGSHYALACAHAARARGWHYVVPHFRGCSGEPNRTVRSYHSGDISSIEWMLQTVAQTKPLSALCAAGISLGGNALAKFCGTRVHAAKTLLRAASSVCSPIDLSICGERIARGFNKVYSANFLRTMKTSAAQRAEKFPGTFDAPMAAQARTIAEFDQAYTAPVHGYRSVVDYYAQASAQPNLRDIAVPFLLIQALNDPFVPEYMAPKSAEISPTVTLDLPRTGGHIGFVSGPFPGNLDWLPQRLITYFSPHVQ